MIQVIITGVLAFLVINTIEKKREGILDNFNVIAFVVVPYLIEFLATIGGGLLGLSPAWLLSLQALYFIVPLLMCRYQTEYSWGISSLYGGIVFGFHIITSIVFMFLINASA